MRITAVEATELFGGTAQHPLQIIRVTVRNDAPAQPGTAPIQVRVEGAAVSTPVAFDMELPEPGGERAAEVGVHLAPPYQPGSPRPVTAVAEGNGERAELAAEIRAAEAGWTMWMVSHFHYDPVWWDTQGEFTESRLLLPDEHGRLPDVRTAFELVELHLAHAREDLDYKFVLAEIDYLKPYLDTHPEHRAELRQLIADGRVEIVGGNYNEPNTNLTGAESTIRNAVYGLGYQREVAGGDPTTAWMLDVFGHDPGYPGLMAAAGLAESAWARGPYHQWGPLRTVGDNRRMQMRSEFEWVSPDGRGLLTSYMANHYGAGWVTHGQADLAAAEQAALGEFRTLAPVAATRNVLLPVGADHVIPSRWVTAIHRDWNERYVWPRFVTAVPREFFAAVRADAAGRGRWLVPQTRDMNPVYPGKDVSYIDTKQAQRAAEVAVRDGELLATLAWLAGTGYPAESLDKAWRQLVFGAHHDAITGTESDQVYLDLLGGWREAWQRGEQARRDAAAALAGQADTSGPASDPGHRALVVFNTLSWPRSGLAAAELEFAAPGPAWITLRDSAGAVPFLAEHPRRHPDGSLAGLTVTFRAADVPGVGYRTYWAAPAPAEPEPAGWAPQPGTLIENDRFLVEADPARGGTLTRVWDKLSGAELIRPGGNELIVQEEYAAHPRWGEGPWLLSPKGPGTGSAAAPAKVTAQRCLLGARLLAEFSLGDLRVTQETLLWDGAQAVEFRSHVDGSIGHDRLLRVRFPADVPGGLPVYQGATAVIGRPFGSVDADAAEHAFTLDNPAHEWFGTGSTARVSWTALSGRAERRAIGVAEIILPGPAVLNAAELPSPRGPVTALVAALAGQGVTATCSWPDGPRYGALDLDSNVPDVRIALGGPEQNPWVARLLESVDPFGAELSRALATGRPLWLPAAQSRSAAFAPGADVRGERDLPVLIVAGPDLAAAVTAVTADLADAEVAVTPLGDDTEPGLAGHSVALLNRGTPSSLVTPDGTLHIALMRSCSAWPSGVWIDGGKRTAPDGSSFSWQHWSHTFEYALAAGPGDWRSAGFAPAGQEYNHALLVAETPVHQGPLPAAASLCTVTGPAMLAALKPRGNPLAAGRSGTPDRAAGVTARLRDLAGRVDGPARVGLFTGIAGASLTRLTEDTGLAEDTRLAEDTGSRAGSPAGDAAVRLDDGAAVTAIGPAATVTLALTVPSAVPAENPPRTEVAAPEPAQPVFARYWLHGKGPAPAGNLPVAVHLSPTRLPVPVPAPGAPGRLRLTVAGGPDGASGLVELDVPDGLLVQPGGPLAYELPPLGFAEWELSVRGAPGAAPGNYFLAARIHDLLGQVIEDAAAVYLGLPPAPARTLPLDELVPAIQAGQQAIAAELEVTVLTPALRVAAGQHGELAVRVASRAASPIRGEAQLISPFGSWPAVRPWTRGFSVSPGKEITLRYHVGVPVTTRRGTQWWTMVKLMYFGRLHYTSAVPVDIRE